MGNEASLEGGEGLGAFPEGAAAAGDGGGPAAPLQHLVPAGVEADLSQLSEEERRQIAAVMSRAQGLPRGNLAGAEPPPMQRAGVAGALRLRSWACFCLEGGC